MLNEDRRDPDNIPFPPFGCDTCGWYIKDEGHCTNDEPCDDMDSQWKPRGDTGTEGDTDVV